MQIWISQLSEKNEIFYQSKLTKGKIVMTDSERNSLPRIIGHQPQLKGVRERAITLVNSHCHQLSANEGVMGRHWRTDHHKPKDDYTTGKLLCLVSKIMKRKDEPEEFQLDTSGAQLK
ncbi:hypothetical protein ACTXT7_011145 [Hymenolepis weldensis]